MSDSPFLGTVTPDEFRRIREIFEAALERPVAERRAFVEHACGGNAALRTDVERMLATEGDRHALLDRASTMPGAAPRGRPSVERDECASCRASLTPSHRFCPSCGTPTAAGAIVEEGRFRAGALFANRFRIVAALGRGGMGEVYRAHDLELGQPVALKFLTALRSDERARARLRTEVRLARQISHPNVCRVYDIGEAHGELYLSMEYVDGEDLAALLKRIGRVPVDKGIEIARKLCAGLAAAHAKGVLHRDFKPANIMIDSAGEVRIMDFGLAAIASELEGAEVRSGTPAYMAPEQLAGREVTKQSDLYALGLVLYELFTGKPPFAAKEVPELQRQRESHPETTPSTLVPELDQRLERTILRCLEPDPKQRPASALDVAAALPGGDPLAEALAAGETPSPEKVAAAGPEGTISPAAGVACLAAIAVALAAVVWTSQRTTLASYVSVERSVDVQVDRARTIAAQLGYMETPVATAHGYEVNVEYLREVANTNPSPARWEVLRDARRSPVGFWYRQSPQPLWPASGAAVTRTDPPDSMPGMVTVVTDPGGRLVRFTAVPPRGTEGVALTADWTELFGLAELPVESFTPTAPGRTPPVFATERTAWTGALPGGPDEQIRIEAAAHQGIPVHFEIVAPWILSEPVSPPEPEGWSALQLVFLFAIIGILGAVVLLFWRNLRLGRADHRGAVRIGAVVGGSVFISLALVTQNPIDFVPWIGRALVGYTSLGAVLLAWANYVALEPYARRVWPETLIGWSRLVAGRVRDALVGREILIGTLGGVIMALLPHLRVLVPAWGGLAPPIPVGGLVEENLEAVAAMFPLLGGRHSLFLLFIALPNAMSVALIGAAALFVLVILLRNRRRAIVAWVLLPTLGRGAAAAFGPDHQTVDFVWAGLVFVIGVVLLTRFGLLAMVTHLLVYWWLYAFPFNLDTAAPQAFASYLMLAAVAAVALYGFRTALGRRSIFESSLFGDDT